MAFGYHKQNQRLTPQGLQCLAHSFGENTRPENAIQAVSYPGDLQVLPKSIAAAAFLRGPEAAENFL
jgi:hypothetical protein